MKFLLWALVLYLVWRWYQSTQKKSERDAANDSFGTQSQSASQATASEEVEKMVSCQHCGIHVPLSEAVQLERGLFFCSTEHQRQHTT